MQDLNKYFSKSMRNSNSSFFKLENHLINLTILIYLKHLCNTYLFEIIFKIAHWEIEFNYKRKQNAVKGLKFEQLCIFLKYQFNSAFKRTFQRTTIYVSVLSIPKHYMYWRVSYSFKVSFKSLADRTIPA